MTALLLDVSRWQVSTVEGGARQGPSLDLSKAAGFSLVNVQLSGKAGYRPGPWATVMADRARAQGMRVCAYWWLDNSAPGQVQAREAVQRMAAVGAQVLQIDCEDNATEPVWRSCVDQAQQLLGRHVAAYTGRWWWKPRGWHGADLTPHLWAMHHTSGRYPGDTSPTWDADYGGWDRLSVLQYGVAPIGGVDCTLSAIRDPNVWHELAGDGMRQAQDHDDDPEQHIGRPVQVDYETGEVEVIADGGPDDRADSTAVRVQHGVPGAGQGV